MLSADDQPAIHLNDELMARVRPQTEKFYYDPSKYGSYLDQLGISYPSGTLAAPAPAQKKSGGAVIN